jgi:predicted RNA polymerase sigma factor
MDQNSLQSNLQNPHEKAESAEIWRQVQTGIGRIEPAYRKILVLRHIEGLSTKEVSEIVGLSVGAVKSRLHRTRGQLREQLTITPYLPKPDCPDIRKDFFSTSKAIFRLIFARPWKLMWPPALPVPQNARAETGLKRMQFGRAILGIPVSWLLITTGSVAGISGITARLL